MANTFDFVPFTGGFTIKLGTDDGIDYPAGFWKVETPSANTLEIRNVNTNAILHTLVVGTDAIKISGVVNAGNVTVIKAALQSVFFKATSTGGGGGSATTNASDLTSGTLSDARLSANVPIKVAGKIVSGDLPSYVDDVLEVANFAALPATGTTGIIYVALDTNYEYRWSGSTYIRLVSSPGTLDEIADTATRVAVSPAQKAAIGTNTTNITKNADIIKKVAAMYIRFLAPLNSATTITTGKGTATFSRSFDSAVLLSSGLYGNAAHLTAAYTWDIEKQENRIQLRTTLVTSAVAGASGTANRDLTQTEWTKTNTTAAKTQTGIDGSANACSLLTATADAGTCLFPITAAAAIKTFSAHIKRAAGGGRILMTRNGGLTYVDITPQINATDFTRVSLKSSILNPSVGFYIEKSGDAIIVDAVSDTDTAYATNPPMVVRAYGRSIDSLVYSAITPAWVAGKRYYASIEAIVQGDLQIMLKDSASNNYARILFTQASSLLNIATRSGSTNYYNFNVTYNAAIGKRIKLGIAFGICQASAIIDDVQIGIADTSFYGASGGYKVDPVSLDYFDLGTANGDIKNATVVEMVSRHRLFLGDSIFAASSFTDIVRRNLDWKQWLVSGRGVSGSLITDITSRISTDVTPNYWVNAIDNAIVLHIGTNTLANNVPAATALAQYQTLIDGIKAANANWKIKITSVLPSRTAGLTGITSSAFTTQANLFNAGLPSLTSVDEFIDFSSISEINDSTNLTWFFDGIHPTSALYELMWQKILYSIY